MYVEALLVDQDLADQVWAALMAGEIDDWSAWAAWLIVAVNCNSSNPYRPCPIKFRQAAFPRSGHWR